MWDIMDGFLEEVTFEQDLMEVREIWGKSVPGRGNSWCKCPEVGLCDLLVLGSLRGQCVAQMVKNLPAMQETGVLFLGWEDPLEKGMATHSSILTFKIHGQRNLVG